jgi:NADPH2:quinone reductase
MGSRCTSFREGEMIYASPSIARNGANAEYVLVDERTAAAKPGSLTVEQAAALPLVTLTAWESLHKRAAIHPGETVFIQGGAGGVGHVALQLCRQHGNPAITTASRPESIELCRRCGADHVINYREENVVERVKAIAEGGGVPVAFDCVGGEAFEQCLDVIAVNGRVVGIVMTTTETIFEKLFRRNATLHLEFMGVPPIYGIDIESHGEILRTAGELADAGKLEPHVQEVIDLERIPDAHRKLAEGHTTGKIVARVKA